MHVQKDLEKIFWKPGLLGLCVYVYTCSVFNINLLHRLPGGGGGGGITWKCCGPFSC